MEIKIICHSIDNQNKQSKTFIYEGSDISHQFVQYKGIADFQEVYNQNVQGKPGWVIGIPQSFWQNEKIGSKEDVEGFFLLIYLNDDNGDFKFIVVKDATIFITSKGQTIDKVLVP